MSERKPLGVVASIAVGAFFVVGVGVTVVAAVDARRDYRAEIRAETIDLDNATLMNRLYADRMAAAIETRFLNIEQEIELLRGSSEPLGELINARDLSLSMNWLLAESPAYQMYIGAYDGRAPYNAEADVANRRLNDLEAEVDRLKGLLTENGIDPETGELIDE